MSAELERCLRIIEEQRQRAYDAKTALDAARAERDALQELNLDLQDLLSKVAAQRDAERDALRAERDALQALVNDVREACGHGPTGGITLDLFRRLDVLSTFDLFRRLDAAAKDDQ